MITKEREIVSSSFRHRVSLYIYSWNSWHIAQGWKKFIVKIGIRRKRWIQYSKRCFLENTLHISIYIFIYKREKSSFLYLCTSLDSFCLFTVAFENEKHRNNKDRILDVAVVETLCTLFKMTRVFHYIFPIHCGYSNSI